MSYAADKNHHGWQLPRREKLLTPASLLTMCRTLIALGLAGYAFSSGQINYVYFALAVYWVGDVLDGIVARFFKHEMRLGAVLDIVSDRLCVAIIYLIFVSFHPEMLVATCVYLFQFMVLDGVLSMSFLFWKLLSPNYFYLVDGPIYHINWSLPAKVFNSSLFILVAIVFVSPSISLLVALINTLVKAYSLKRLTTIIPGNPRT